MTILKDKMPLTRRSFLVKGSIASGALALGVGLPGCSSSSNRMLSDGSWEANAWLEISREGRVTFTLDRVEMGQGTYTGITTLLAEELNHDPESIDVVFAEAAQVYRNKGYGLQITGGSNSLATHWVPIREAAAAAREMLILAASKVLEVPIDQLTLENGRVQSEGGKGIAMGELVSLASQESVPSSPQLKKPEDFKYIGRHSKRLDAQKKVMGTAAFGIDVDVEGMVYAVVVHPPSIGARLSSFDASAISNSEQFVSAVAIDSGLAVVARSYWAARSLSSQVVIDWEKPAQPITTEAAFSLYQSSLDEDDGESVRTEGNIEKAFEDTNGQVIELEYEMPFLAHATMEPMNCVAHVQEHRADVWASTQGPDIAQVVVAKATHLDLDEVHVHTQFLGGGFGRRLNQDFVGEAAEISAAIKQPVKLVWSREDDMRNDFYRPASLHRLKAVASADGISGWKHTIAAPGVMDWYIWDAAPAMFPASPKFMYPMLGKVGLATAGTPMTPADRSAYEGADDLEYEFDAQEVRHVKADIGVPAGFWRAVGHSHNGFVTESFIDACADAVDQDPVDYRLAMLSEHPRLSKVLQVAAEKGGWKKPAAEGVFRGIAAHKSFGSYVAELVELSIESNEIKVHKVVCAIDCGLVVNPDVVTMQMESCVVFGLTAALYGEITFVDGLAQQSNFHDYRMLRNNECPEIEVHLVESREPPTGVGEPGLPPLAAAIGSALFRATGKRHTKLPFKLAEA